MTGTCQSGTADLPGSATVLRAGRLLRAVLLCAIVGIASLTPADRLDAQTLHGRVVEDGSEAAISTALVRLMGEEGDVLAISIADSAGYYRVEAPSPGVYRLSVSRLGFHTVESPLLDAAVEDGEYPIDLVMYPAPVELPGFTVETNRVSPERLARRVRLMTGLNPASMRVRPIPFEDLLDHAERGHDLADMMRWTNAVGIITKETTDGPCFQVRNRACLPIYLDGTRMNPELIAIIPLDMLETVVILYPHESIAYNDGAVLMYTEAWIR